MIQGADFELNYRSAAGPPAVYGAVADMNSFSKASDRNSSDYPVFQRSTPYQINGAKTQTYDVGGYLAPGDAGQAALLAAEAAQTTIVIQVLWDGTNGFTQPVLVKSYSVDTAPDAPQGIKFSFTAQGDPTIAGTGPIL